MKRTDITALIPDIDKDILDKIMDLNGADINKVKAGADALRDQLSAAQAELQQLRDSGADPQKLAAVQQELDDLKKANTVRDIREKVSKDTGVPASLLTGDTEDACKSQAEAIKAYANPSGGSYVPDGGEVRDHGGAKATRDKFAEFMADKI